MKLILITLPIILFVGCSEAPESTSPWKNNHYIYTPTPRKLNQIPPSAGKLDSKHSPIQKTPRDLAIEKSKKKQPDFGACSANDLTHFSCD